MLMKGPGRMARLLTAAVAATAFVPLIPVGLAHATVGPAPAAPAAAIGNEDTSLLVGLDPGAGISAAVADRTGLRRATRRPAVAVGDGGAGRGKGTARRHAAELRSRSDVRYVEPNTAIHASATPNDPAYPEQWPLQSLAPAIGATGAWDRTTGSRNIVVGVLDSGADLTHPDLVANLWSNPGGVGGCAAGTHGVNEVEGGCIPQDGFGHGTHVAGTIGAVGNNGVGVAGINWATNLMPLRILDDTGTGSISGAVAAIQFAVQAKTQSGVNIRVPNVSWSDGGGQAPSIVLHDAIQDASNAGILFVTAAGNRAVGANLDGSPEYPCSFHLANEICVAASGNNPADTLADFSNYGPGTVDLAAPGVDIVSTWVNGDYAALSGTSMATPHVAGAAASMLAGRAMTMSTLKSTLLASVAIEPGLIGRVATGGRLDLACARSAPPRRTGARRRRPWAAASHRRRRWRRGRRVGSTCSPAMPRASSRHVECRRVRAAWESLGGGLVGVARGGGVGPRPARRLRARDRQPAVAPLVRWLLVGVGATRRRARLGARGPSWARAGSTCSARGSDGQLWQRSYAAPGWSGWRPLGGQLGGDPAAVSWGSGRIDVFVRGTDGQVWQRFMNAGAWVGGWIGMGGQAVGGTAASSRGTGLLDVYVTGTNGHLWHRWFDGSWHGYQDLGGNLTTGPGSVSKSRNHVDVVSRGIDAELTHFNSP